MTMDYIPFIIYIRVSTIGMLNVPMGTTISRFIPLPDVAKLIDEPTPSNSYSTRAAFLLRWYIGKLTRFWQLVCLPNYRKTIGKP